MNFERYQQLHSIVMLKDFLRKWWQMELCFTDAQGSVLDWAQGDLVAPPNEACRASLFSSAGRERCAHSVRALSEKFRSSKKLRRCQFHECHLGFTVVGAPLYLENEYRGMVFVEGFRREALPSANGQVPLIVGGELEKLTDLLEFAVQEIAHYEATTVPKDKRIEALTTALSGRYRFESIVGTSAPMREVFRLLEKVSGSESTVLINGESGTGKELVARAIHFNGPRKDKPFVVQNCSAFNDNLLESALFGHVKGAFTGAIRDQKGLFETAHEGTFFLDEIGDMSPTLQVKLLRVLQEGTFLPVGGNHPREVNVRVIAATHKDLSVMVTKGEFREDLFYRINVIHLKIPPLRERREDLQMLVHHFLSKHRGAGQKTKGLSAGALETLARYSWPGNIRELENEIERLMVLGSDVELIPADLISPRIRDNEGFAMAHTAAPLKFDGNLNEAVEALEKEMILQGLKRTRNNKSRLSRELGISRSNLILKIQRYGLDEGFDGEASA